MIRMIAATGVLLMLQPALAADVDYTEIWHACDEAAADEGFAEAGVPTQEIRGSTNPQLGGRWEGQTLYIVSASTSTGQVFCMTDEEQRVVHYKFQGRTIIERD